MPRACDGDLYKRKFERNSAIEVIRRHPLQRFNGMIYALLSCLSLCPFFIQAAPFPLNRESCSSGDTYHLGLIVHLLSAAGLVARAPGCSDAKIWHTQTYSLMDDILKADELVGKSSHKSSPVSLLSYKLTGLSAPTRAVMMMCVSHDQVCR